MCEFIFLLFSSVNNDDKAFHNNQPSAECWSFVEKTLKITIPIYIKNVLLYCGYDNFHTISTIEEKDLDNITAQVQKGGIVDYFSNKTSNATYNPLQGSNKSEENFEFLLGHRKLLMLIVNTLNQNLVKIIPTSIKNNEKAREKAANSSLNHNQDGNDILDDINVECIPTPFFHEDIIRFQATLLKKTIQSLFTHSHEMYEKNMENIGEKICNDLVYVSYKNRKRLYSAEIKCPYCSTKISVKHTSDAWHTTNFDNHLTSVHIYMKYKFNPEIVTEIKGTDKQDLEVKEQTHRNVCLSSSLQIQEETHSVNFICIGDQLIGKKDQTDISTIDSSEVTDHGEKIYDKQDNIYHVLPFDPNANQLDQKIISEKRDTIRKYEYEASIVGACQDVQNISAGTFLDPGAMVVVKEGDFVLLSATNEAYTRWPDSGRIVPYFIGQVARNDVDDKIELLSLERCHDSKFIFVFKKDNALKIISKENIVKILQDPTENRRQKLVFKDESLLDFDI